MTIEVPLVDTNVLFDLLTADPVWVDWSLRQLEIQALRDRLIINPVVYAELSISFDRLEDVDTFLDETGVRLDDMPRSALFLAGRAFQAYRARGGSRTGVLPDFFIGAHAVVENVGLLTRDLRCYRSYFPAIRLITPGDA